MTEGAVPTTLVYGFLDAGKTHFIQSSLLRDFFYKRGSTLLLCFEAGEEEYDEAALAGKRVSVACYEGGEDLTAFCLRQIEKYRPDRIWVEMNAMTEGLRAALPESMKVVFRELLVDTATLPLYVRNMRQYLQNMVQDADQLIFRGGMKEDLAPYSQLFRLMNRKASYLWEGPGGYHEKAFDLFVPYELEAPELTIKESDYVAFCLHSTARPELYEGKIIRLTAQAAPEGFPGGPDFIGRQVMTCCLADVQFLGCPCHFPTGEEPAGGQWLTVTAHGMLKRDEYGRGRLLLQIKEAVTVPPPKELLLNGLG